MMGIVYKIIVENDDRIYIGSTVSFSKRKREHERDLQNGNHHCIHLQRFYDKNHPKIIFEIICECSDYLEKEQFYLDTITEKFNTSNSATAPMLGKTHTEKYRKELSIRLTENNPVPKGSKRQDYISDILKTVNIGRKHSKENIANRKKSMPNMKPVIYDGKGYISISALAEEKKVHRNNISKALRNNLYHGKQLILK